MQRDAKRPLNSLVTVFRSNYPCPSNDVSKSPPPTDPYAKKHLETRGPGFLFMSEPC